MMDALLDLTAQMAREGIRRLLVLSGDEAWTLQQAQTLRERLGGDGLWVGPDAVSAPCVAPGALKTLLGREVMHAFFDARRGCDVAALAALSGTLRAGSWLVLLTPPFADWLTRADEDSLRWSDTPDPIVTPNFVHRCCRQFIADPEVLLWQQSDRPRFPLAAPRPDWHPADGHPQAEQALILEQLSRLPPGIAAVTAERGRGKSALAGMLLRQLEGEAIVTAPTRSAVEVLASFAGEAFR
ncbi:TPA: tRNA(Met) cytidine acetyltransferase, partial [Klebsiella variicola]|nr:tRNA(Met) cytidine acetyltransferase [Klebsiella variicola]